MFFQHKRFYGGEPQGTPLALRDAKSSGAVAFVAEAVGGRTRYLKNTRTASDRQKLGHSAGIVHWR